MVNRIVGTEGLSATLHRVQKAAEELEYGLLLWDDCRPQCAVDYFLNWASLPESNLTEKRYYPNIERKEMVTRGYMASQSGYSRGSAIDFTIFRLGTSMLVPMGGDFGFMDVRSYHAISGLSEKETNNGESLRAVIERSRLEAYRYEWWRYVLVDESYPDTYFDFCVA